MGLGGATLYTLIVSALVYFHSLEVPNFLVNLHPYTILDFGLGILDWGSFAQRWFQSANCRVLCLNRY
jgi:hypothetical protein